MGEKSVGLGDRIRAKLDAQNIEAEKQRAKAEEDEKKRATAAVQKAKLGILRILEEEFIEHLIDVHSGFQAGIHRVFIVGLKSHLVAIFHPQARPNTDPQFTEQVPVEVDYIAAIKAFNSPEIQARIGDLAKEGIQIEPVSSSAHTEGFLRMKVDYTRVGKVAR